MPKQRPYQRSHPWLKFQLELRPLPSTFWVQLGAVQSKCRHVAQTLLPPQLSRELHELFLARGVHATTAIEGNTLTEAQVHAAAEGRLRVAPSHEYQKQEVENVLKACRRIERAVFEADDRRLTVDRICDYNRWVLEGLPLEPHVQPGFIRNYSVGVASYRGAPHEDCQYLLEQLCDWLNTIQSPSEETETGYAIIRAVVAHVYLAWIHPFGDGNGRTARLVEFAILLVSGVPDVSVHLLSNHYNQTRTEYYRQLDRASRSGGDLSHFLQYAMEGMRDALNAQIDEITSHQFAATWKEHVWDVIPEMSKTRERQRLVALALWKNYGIRDKEVRRLTTRIAEAYAGLTNRAIQRDIAALQERGLLSRLEDGRIVPEFRPLSDRLPRRADQVVSPPTKRKTSTKRRRTKK